MGTDTSESPLVGLGLRGLVDHMHHQPDESAARDQTENLLESIVEIGSDLDLDATLERIVCAAMRLTRARYGAVGVRAADGTLKSFVPAGMSPQAVKRIGQLPVGEGLLGLLLDRTDALRLDDLTRHPAAIGFPDQHPLMRAFLGVPILIRGEVFGSLYLSDDSPGRVFTESDEIAVRVLVSAAAVTIENALLFDHVALSARWITASREITTALLSVDSHRQPLQLIADRAAELTDAEQGIVLVPTDPDLPAEDVDTLIVSTAVGSIATEVIGQRVPVEGSTTGEAFRAGAPVITDSFRHPIPSFTDVGERPAIVVPLRAGNAVLGVLAVARNRCEPRFDARLAELLSDFAGHAAVALTLAEAREQAQQLCVLADRERIARDLHDHVIQRLFVAGMNLQSTIGRVHAPEVIERLTRTVDDLQSTIDDLRAAIFELHAPVTTERDFRQRIRAAVNDLTRDRTLHATLRILGPTTAIEPTMADHAEAVLTEAVSNTVRHSGATKLTVEVSVAEELTIDVVDNGCGIPADNQRHSGLANLASRAAQVGGSCQVSNPLAGGTHVHWAAPLALV